MLLLLGVSVSSCSDTEGEASKLLDQARRQFEISAEGSKRARIRQYYDIVRDLEKIIERYPTSTIAAKIAQKNLDSFGIHYVRSEISKMEKDSCSERITFICVRSSFKISVEELDGQQIEDNIKAELDAIRAGYYLARKPMEVNEIYYILRFIALVNIQNSDEAVITLFKSIRSSVSEQAREIADQIVEIQRVCNLGSPKECAKAASKQNWPNDSSSLINNIVSQMILHLYGSQDRFQDVIEFDDSRLALDSNTEPLSPYFFIRESLLRKQKPSSGLIESFSDDQRIIIDRYFGIKDASIRAIRRQNAALGFSEYIEALEEKSPNSEQCAALRVWGGEALAVRKNCKTYASTSVYNIERSNNINEITDAICLAAKGSTRNDEAINAAITVKIRNLKNLLPNEMRSFAFCFGALSVNSSAVALYEKFPITIEMKSEAYKYHNFGRIIGQLGRGEYKSAATLLDNTDLKEISGSTGLLRLVNSFVSLDFPFGFCYVGPYYYKFSMYVGKHENKIAFLDQSILPTIPVDNLLGMTPLFDY
ncbi:hypothetical protein [Prosthecomicrobium hirschii]|uniref:hypothetical protein n=1 Tax=Prosthecodimorpha hirschii TaxID=665126 RepID=UPI0022208FEC|nr:hypothetical protein [Prosthecomicrobium hirschii]MCW1841578.1 hypothetical protein [Prosthecomicrobium hirschii]